MIPTYFSVQTTRDKLENIATIVIMSLNEVHRVSTTSFVMTIVQRIMLINICDAWPGTGSLSSSLKTLRLLGTLSIFFLRGVCPQMPQLLSKWWIAWQEDKALSQQSNTQAARLQISAFKLRKKQEDTGHKNWRDSRPSGYGSTAGVFHWTLTSSNRPEAIGTVPNEAAIFLEDKVGVTKAERQKISNE